MKLRNYLALLLAFHIFLSAFFVLQFTGNIGFGNTFSCEEGNQYQLIGVEWLTFPIVVSIDKSITNEFQDDVKVALSTWDELTTTQLFKLSDTEPADLTISQGQVSTLSPEFIVIGETSFYNEKHERLTYNDSIIGFTTIVMNQREEFVNEEFSCKLHSLDFTGPYDFLSILVHELGHVLGIGHNDDVFTTMYPYFMGTFQQTLSQGDIDALFAVYPFLEKT